MVRPQPSELLFGGLRDMADECLTRGPPPQEHLKAEAPTAASPQQRPPPPPPTVERPAAKLSRGLTLKERLEAEMKEAKAAEERAEAARAKEVELGRHPTEGGTYGGRMDGGTYLPQSDRERYTIYSPPSGSGSGTPARSGSSAPKRGGSFYSPQSVAFTSSDNLLKTIMEKRKQADDDSPVAATPLRDLIANPSGTNSPLAEPMEVAPPTAVSFDVEVVEAPQEEAEEEETTVVVVEEQEVEVRIVPEDDLGIPVDGPPIIPYSAEEKEALLMMVEVEVENDQRALLQAGSKNPRESRAASTSSTPTTVRTADKDDAPIIIGNASKPKRGGSWWRRSLSLGRSSSKRLSSTSSSSPSKQLYMQAEAMDQPLLTSKKASSSSRWASLRAPSKAFARVFRKRSMAV